MMEKDSLRVTPRLAVMTEKIMGQWENLDAEGRVLVQIVEEEWSRVHFCSCDEGLGSESSNWPCW